MQNEEQYLRQIRTLPVPTFRQIALFSSYVARAHSWYKRLPARRVVPFYLHLNLHSGEFFCYESKGRKVFRPKEEPAGGFFHYSEQTTLDYRRRFGYWDFTANPEVLLSYMESELWEDNSKFSVRAVDSDGVEYELPEQIQRLGRVGLSAFMHPLPFLLFWESQWAASRTGKAPLETPNLLNFLRRREESAPHLGDPPSLPTSLAQAVESQNWCEVQIWEERRLF